ncbi:hypothetical protein PVAND_012545 [Polypedilum vanderplanki]|uniref:Uncharacterized protein n=1 Tax=Polypedilum vanderplanki TaxID=319348 RepID=A0A9J6CMR3_POLVA|nr:hypothetical protein PVAND_012545 [Polypedilum vanderplanki]
MIKSLKKFLLKIFDYGFSSFVITPLLVLFWFSTWSTFDLLSISDENKIIVFAIGLCGQFFLLYHHDVLRRIFNVENQIAFAFLSRFYVLICGIVNICFWRLVWISYDMISTNDDNSIILNIIQNSVILMAFKVFVNSISIPFIIAFDDDNDKNEKVPEIFSYLKKSKSDGILFIIDCICTIVITTIIVCLWRDIWTLANNKIYSSNELYSSLTSMFIGYFVALLCFIIHPCVRALCEAFIVSRIFYHDCYVALCLFATLNIWRGLWSIFNMFIAENIAIIILINITSWLLLILLGCSNSLSIGSILIDGERECLKFQHNYISKLFLLESTSTNVEEVKKSNEV